MAFRSAFPVWGFIHRRLEIVPILACIGHNVMDRNIEEHRLLAQGSQSEPSHIADTQQTLSQTILDDADSD